MSADLAGFGVVPHLALSDIGPRAENNIADFFRWSGRGAEWDEFVQREFGGKPR